METGVSETLSRQRLDAQWWITSSRGDVKVVILIAVNSCRPQITIEKWIPDPGAGSLRRSSRIRSSRIDGIRGQEVIMTREPNDIITTTETPLVITFYEIFLRPANPPQEHDVVISAEALEMTALDIWGEQKI